MRKKLVILTCLFCLMFSSLVFADELKEEKVLSTMDLESINNSLNKVGLKSVSLHPSDDYVRHASIIWSNYGSLAPGSSSSGVLCVIRMDESNTVNNNYVKFNLPSQYGSYNVNEFAVTKGSCDEFTVDGNLVTIYNPANIESGTSYDFVLSCPFNTPYVNNTDSAIPLNIPGIIMMYSSGLELLEILKSYFTVNQVVVILSAAVGSCITLVFMWWGVRKMAYAIMSAFKKGKLRI